MLFWNILGAVVILNSISGLPIANVSCLYDDKIYELGTYCGTKCLVCEMYEVSDPQCQLTCQVPDCGVGFEPIRPLGECCLVCSSRMDDFDQFDVPDNSTVPAFVY
ncbi:uncharacterized protein LOC131950085 [Physella acuta]|uniref:uncharacterized protein LOC131950085 n=1 Tax=Physella acuta TaxID=109671 RepID=UPI0027DD2129|nr:uncharacterized protein LOC131950085 [Physella acuta]